MSAPTRPLRRDAQRNRDLLVAAAKDVFAARGLDAPLEDVAREAGVSIGTLYNRFPTRAELIDAALIDVVEESVASAERALAHPDPWQGLVDHLTAIGELQARHRGFTDICVRTLPAGSATEQAKGRGHGLFVALLERARGAGALRPDVDVSDVGLLMWAAVRATEGLRAVAPDAWRRHVGIVLDGLRGEAAHPLPGGPLSPDAVRDAMAFGRLSD
ncbi:TetR/AcrR family transcriptional regulator [Cryptosporangium aurantiacum]|uniref:Transcriptional regulator, TetR family n=1 Tax=Cryptosporangium aurantiacum TaxID=134849 RepID=A0A1M7RG10_9ACTN|nr:TetR/AcrR family transcriptional regulator [Cryptosporangium aurantiacum]SHN45079.1 transcriptional regulator, TetR family [Cryptosporangium aurantiacum]